MTRTGSSTIPPGVFRASRFAGISVHELRPRKIEGGATCNTFTPPGDVAKITCSGGDIVPLAIALEPEP
jgi:hypothetical protein